MDGHSFDRRIGAARRWLGAAAKPGPVSREQQAVWVAILEELHVAMEELRQQNEELSKTREAVEMDRRRYRELFEEVPESYLVTDPAGTIQEANHRAGQLFGLRQEFLVGNPLAVFVVPGDRPAFYAHLTRMQGAQTGGGSPRILPVRVQPRGSPPIPATLTVGAVQGLRGRVIGLRWLVRESGEHPVADQSHQGEQREALGTRTGGSLHDFNNFVASMIGHAERAMDSLPPHSLAWHALQDVLGAGRRATDLLRRRLVPPHQGEPERNPLALHLVIQDALRLMQVSLPLTIELRQEFDPDSGMVQADVTEMHQVLMNLCVNAEHAMRAGGGTLVVRVENTEVSEDFAVTHPRLAPGPHVRLTVRDTGQGMTSQIQARIFATGFTTKPIGEGTGMGLAVVHSIVATHRGAITVNSAPGAGTTVAVYFPRWNGVRGEIPPGSESVRRAEGKAQPPVG